METLDSRLSSKHLFALMGFVALAFAYIVVREGLNAKLILAAVLFLGGMAFFVKGFVRNLFRGEVLIYFILVYLPFSKQIPVDFGGGIAALNGTNLLIALGALFWLAKREKGAPFLEANPLSLPIFVFVLMGLFSIVRGSGFGPGYLAESSFHYYRLWIVPFFLYFFIFNVVRDRQAVRKAAILWMMVVVVVGLTAIYEYLNEDDRVGGVFDQPNVLAFFFAYGMFLFMGFFLVSSREKPVYWGFLIPFLICFRAVMVTFSRAGYLAFVVGLYAITYVRSKVLFLLLILATLFVIQNPAFLPEGIRYRLAQTLERRTDVRDRISIGGETLDKSTSDRIKLWAASKAMIRDHPVLGVGFHLFEAKVLHYWTGTESWDPHNSYLLIAAELGIPALLVFFWILWRIFRNARTLYRNTQDPFVKAFTLGFLGGFFAFLASNLYGSRVLYPEAISYFWILAALVMRLARLEGKNVYQRGGNIACNTNIMRL